MVTQSLGMQDSTLDRISFDEVKELEAAILR
jgi:hypothetical protein